MICIERILLFVFASVLVVPPLAAQSTAAIGYPQKTVRLIVPFPPGGSTETLARMVSVKLAEMWGQQIIIDNRPGAGGIIGTELGAKAVADGYTLLMGSGAPLTIIPGFQMKLGYDPLKDFAPITNVAAVPNVIALHPSVPARDVKALVALARAQPDQLSFSSNGAGSPGHLAGELFKNLGGVEIVHVPYRGIAPAFTDIIGGQTDAMFPTLFAAIPYIETGRVRALAITGQKRSPTEPNVPTFKELGYPGFDGQQWYGIAGPANMPEAIVTKLNSELNKVLANPEFSEKMASESMTVMPMSPQQFGNYIKEDIARWSKVAKDRHIEIE